MAVEAVMADLAADPGAPSGRADHSQSEVTSNAGHRSTDAIGATRAAEATPRCALGRGTRIPSPSSAGSRSRHPMQ
eukprot:15443520-Alexandrium_andersonii.AAC.1